MNQKSYATDQEEGDAIVARLDEVRQQRRGGEFPAEHIEDVERLTVLLLKTWIGVDRGGTTLPFRRGMWGAAVTYLFRIVILLAPLIAFLALAALPLVFIDPSAALALFLID